MTSSDETYCTTANPDNSLVETATSTSYTAASGSRSRLALFSPTVEIANEQVFGLFVEDPGFNNAFIFNFVRAASSSSKKYTACTAASSSAIGNATRVREGCNSCTVCDNGVDFKYDCSNVNGNLIYNNTTNTTEIGPGPTLESCIPITRVLPLF
jgi:hypothetical protein